jgi:hypothetical protein
MSNNNQIPLIYKLTILNTHHNFLFIIYTLVKNTLELYSGDLCLT